MKKKKGKKKEKFREERRIEEREHYDLPLDRGPKFEYDERGEEFKTRKRGLKPPFS